jgi:hypothetical protein
MADTRAFCDCHVNIWNEKHVLPLYHQQLGRLRQGEMAPKANADTLYGEMERAIVLALRYGDTRSGSGATTRPRRRR